MKLDELIEYLQYDDLINFKNVEISGISYNSKTTKKGDIFICLSYSSQKYIFPLFSPILLNVKIIACFS